MATVKRRSTVPYYAAAGTWVIYALLFPLYRVPHFILVTAASAVVFFIMNAVCGTVEVTVPDTPKKEETTGNPELDKMIRDGNLAISERTKEIGVMKALGCYVRDIRAMFLMEAGSIGLLGGVLGLLFSFIISVGINLFSFGAFSGGGVTWELIKQALIGGENVTRVSVIKPELIIFALVFSVLVGLVSGYQPANKAVKISALEAIRNE